MILPLQFYFAKFLPCIIIPAQQCNDIGCEFLSTLYLSLPVILQKVTDKERYKVDRNFLIP